MGPAPGGVLTIKVAYGPIRGSMKTAETKVYVRENEEMTFLNESIDIDFEPFSIYQYRCNIVVYIEAWCAGEGENNPYTILTGENGCFVPQPSALSITIQ